MTDAAAPPASAPSAPADPSSLPPEAIAFAQRLFTAARTGTDDETLTVALSAGVPPNLRNEAGDTMTMLAAYHGHASTVRILVSKGGDPNILNDRGQSPLSGAVYKNEREVVEALLDGGADPNLGTPTALDAARMFGNTELGELLERRAMQGGPAGQTEKSV